MTMRRKDKMIQERAEMDAVLHEATVVHVAMWDGQEPYLVPLNFGYDGESLFVHTATEGRKVRIFEQFPRVCFEAEAGVEIRDGGDTACAWGCRYRSIVGYARIERVRDSADVLHALRTIMRKYAGRDDHAYLQGSLERVATWRLVIERMDGKRAD